MTKNTVNFDGAFTTDTRQIINDNFVDISYCTTQTSVTSSTALVNLPGMATGVLEPGVWRFKIHLAGTANASGGTKVAFKFGTASMLSSLEAVSKAFAAAAVAVARANTATDQASLTAVTAANLAVEIIGTVVVAIPGTLQLQMAQNASNGSATTIYANGSFMEFIKM